MAKLNNIFSIAVLMVSLGIFSCERKAIKIEVKKGTVVTLVPSVGEMVSDVLADQIDRIIGVSEYSDYPEKLKSIDKVGSHLNVNYEKILSLAPEMVITTKDSGSPDVIKRLQEFGIRVEIISTGRLVEIPEAYERLGVILNRKTIGDTLAKNFRAAITHFRDRVSKRIFLPGGNKPRTAFVVSTFPLQVAGGNSLYNDAIEIIGGENLYSLLKGAYPKISAEDLVKNNPDFIFFVVYQKGVEVELKNFFSQFQG